MNKRDIARTLNTVECPNIETPIFQECLKQVISCRKASKVELLIQTMEQGMTTVVSSRMVFGGLAMSVGLFAVVWLAGEKSSGAVAVNQVQASEAIRGIETASQTTSRDRMTHVESQLQMSWEDAMAHAQAAHQQMIYDLDLARPLGIIDSQSGRAFLVSFHPDSHGRLSGRIHHQPNRLTLDKMATQAAEYKVLQYQTPQGDVVMVVFDQGFQPETGVVLSGN